MDIDKKFVRLRKKEKKLKSKLKKITRKIEEKDMLRRSITVVLERIINQPMTEEHFIRFEMFLYEQEENGNIISKVLLDENK